MEYVFGANGDVEILKTKGNAHSDLTGFQNVVRDYPNETIEDNFRVVLKTKSAEEEEGNCYDWYEIDRHSRTVSVKPVSETEEVSPMPEDDISE